MNCCFYLAIDRLPLGTVAAIEFLPVVLLGRRSARARAATGSRSRWPVAGVYMLTGVHLEGEAVGLGFAFANAALFALYIVLAHKTARHPALTGIDGLALAMLIAAAAVTPIAGSLRPPGAHRPGRDPRRPRRRRLIVGDPVRRRPARHAGAAARHYALMVSLLPATATIIGVIVLAQVPSARELTGVALVIVGVALHRDREAAAASV
jgi:inner membrane transporter RhtA